MGLRRIAGLGLVLAATTFLSGCLNTTPRYRRPPTPVPVKGAARTPANVPSPTPVPGVPQQGVPQQGAFNTSAGAPVSPTTSGSNFRTVAPAAPVPTAAPTGVPSAGLPAPAPGPVVPTVYNGPAPTPAPPGPAPTPTVGSNVTITQPPFPAGPAIQPPPPPR